MIIIMMMMMIMTDDDGGWWLVITPGKLSSSEEGVMTLIDICHQKKDQLPLPLLPPPLPQGKDG